MESLGGPATWVAVLPDWLPRGDSLPAEQWRKRHRGLTALLWVHLLVVPLVGVVNGHGALHSLLESSVLTVLAIAASSGRVSRTIAMLATTLGLVTASALLVHLSGGLIEMHFHFFIIVAAVTLYQSWLPFLVAIFYVVVHHGAFGMLYPEDVFNHPAAIAKPWKWAAVHGLFVAGASAVGITAWRFNEGSQQAAAEAKFQSLVEALPATFYKAEPGSEGVWTYLSPQFENLFGLAPEEWLSDPAAWYRSVHPDDQDRVLEHERDILRTGNRHSIEYRLRRPDGGTVWVRDEATLVRDGTGSPYLQGFMLDITARKEAEADAAMSEAHRKAIVGGALDGIIVADMSGRILEFNPAAENIFGYGREEILGRDLAETIIPPPFRAQHRAGLARYGETGESRVLRQRIKVEGMRRDGSQFPLELSITHDQGGGKDVVVGYLRDITSVKESEAELAERARRQSAVVELGHMALSGVEVATLLNEGVKLVGEVLDVDLCHVFEILPDRQLRLTSGFGWPEDLVGRGMLGGGPETQAGYTIRSTEPVVVDDFRTETRFSASPAVLGQDVTSGVSVLIRGAGDEPFGVLGAHTKAQRTFTTDEVNFLQAIANIFSTAIQRKEAEESKIRLEDQLSHAQKMEAVGALAGGIAHDFNNLLAVITGYATFLESDLGPGDPKREDLQEILNASDKGTNLVRQLLTFSRKEPIRLEVLNVNDVIVDVTTMLQRTVRESIQLTVETAAESPHAEIDRGHLVQVIMNLVINAKDAMPGGGSLSIRSSDVVLDEESAPAYGLGAGTYVCISVTDDGIGLSPEIRGRIFDPFFTTKGKGAGTGLGLATVYGIVKRAGGHIAVYSEEGSGTTFRVYLPQVEPQRQDAGGPAPGEHPELDGSETILLVEDEEAIRALVDRILSQRGYNVISSTSPLDALRTAQELDRIDLLVTDIVMPDLTGKEVSEALNQTRRVRTLYMSGYTDDIINQHGLIEAGSFYLEKPFAPVELLKMVRKALEATW